MSFFQDVKKIKVSDLILWSENPRDPISKEADNNAIIKHALEDKNNVWKLRDFAKDMGDLYFYSELPTVVYKEDSPIVYDGNRRVILAKLSLGFFDGDSSIKKYPYVEQEMPCNVCDENTALQYVLKKHSERGGWKPLDRDLFCYKYLGKKKSVFLIINDLLDDYINLHPDINKVFVKDELLSANKLSKLNIDIDSRGFIRCPYTLDELKKIIINLLDQVSNGSVSTRSNRGDVYTILNDHIKKIIELKKDEQEVNMMPPLTWAYVGDCVYELYIRTKLVNETKLKPHALHIEAIKHVKAQAQAETLKKIYDDLTEKEQDIVRRGRNAENHHLPKNANVQDYMYSTAFEALIGYLYLTKQNDRLKEILEKE